MEKLYIFFSYVFDKKILDVMFLIKRGTHRIIPVSSSFYFKIKLIDDDHFVGLAIGLKIDLVIVYTRSR